MDVRDGLVGNHRLDLFSCTTRRLVLAWMRVGVQRIEPVRTLKPGVAVRTLTNTSVELRRESLEPCASVFLFVSHGTKASVQVRWWHNLLSVFAIVRVSRHVPLVEVIKHG